MFYIELVSSDFEWNISRVLISSNISKKYSNTPKTIFKNSEILFIHLQSFAEIYKKGSG